MRTKVILFVHGIDEGFIGQEICGFKLKKTQKFDDGSDYIYEGKRCYEYAESFLLNYGYAYLLNEKHLFDFGKKPYFLYFEKEYINKEKNDYLIFIDSFSLIASFRLTENSRIAMLYPHLVSENGQGSVLFHDERKTYITRGDFFLKDYKNTDLRSINLIYSKLQTIYPHLNKKNELYNRILRMIDIFHESFKNPSESVRFIQRMIIWEMLIEGNGEIAHKIARLIAVFLGRDKNESHELFEKAKKIYSARSKYIHGVKKDVDGNHCLDNLEITRRLIANLIFLEDSIEEFREKINESGFGDNPFNVQF